MLILSACGTSQTGVATPVTTTTTTEATTTTTTEATTTTTEAETTTTTTEATTTTTEAPTTTTTAKPTTAHKHSWSQWEITNYPNPGELGKQQRVCATCSKKETETIATSPYVGMYSYNSGYKSLSSSQKGKWALNIRYAWWENGKLVLDCYIVNDTKSKITLPSEFTISIEKQGALMAEGTFNLSQITLTSGEAIYHRLTFSSGAFDPNAYGSDLSVGLSWTYQT